MASPSILHQCSPQIFLLGTLSQAYNDIQNRRVPDAIAALKKVSLESIRLIQMYDCDFLQMLTPRIMAGELASQPLGRVGSEIKSGCPSTEKSTSLKLAEKTIVDLKRFNQELIRILDQQIAQHKADIEFLRIKVRDMEKELLRYNSILIKLAHINKTLTQQIFSLSTPTSSPLQAHNTVLSERRSPPQAIHTVSVVRYRSSPESQRSNPFMGFSSQSPAHSLRFLLDNA